MSTAELEINKIRGRLHRVAFANSFFARLSIWMFVFGALLLILRYFGVWSDYGWFANLALVPIALFSWRQAAATVPDREAVRAWLDKNYDQGGLLMASAETDLGQWRDLSAAEVSVRWRARGHFLRLAVAAAYVALASLVPNQWFLPPQEYKLDIDAELAELEEKIETLEEADILEEETTAQLREDIETLKQNADGEDPGKTWETLDHLDQSIDRRAMETFEQLAEQDELIDAMEALAERMDTNENNLDEKTLQDAFSEMKALMSEKMAENQQLAEAMKKAGLNQEELAQMSTDDFRKALDMSQEQMQELLQKMEQNQLVKSEMAEKLIQKADEKNEDLQDWLDGEMEGKKLANCKKLCGTGTGKDNMNMSSFLTWRDESNTEDVTFEDMALDPNETANMEHSVLMGTSMTDPETADAVAPARFDALNNAKAGAGSAQTRPVLPRHRAAVKRYFDKATPKKD